MTYVIDASVVIKWFIPEEGSEPAVGLMRQPVSAPDLLIPECVNVLWGKVVRGKLAAAEATAAARVLQSAGISFEPTQPLATDMLALAVRLSHPAYYCAYLALARKLDAVLVTADEKLIARCLRPDAADLAPHVRSLYQLGLELQERRPPRYARRAGS